MKGVKYTRELWFLLIVVLTQRNVIADVFTSYDAIENTFLLEMQFVDAMEELAFSVKSEELKLIIDQYMVLYMILHWQLFFL